MATAFETPSPVPPMVSVPVVSQLPLVIVAVPREPCRKAIVLLALVTTPPSTVSAPTPDQPT